MVKLLMEVSEDIRKIQSDAFKERILNTKAVCGEASGFGRKKGGR